MFACPLAKPRGLYESERLRRFVIDEASPGVEEAKGLGWVEKLTKQLWSKSLVTGLQNPVERGFH